MSEIDNLLKGKKPSAPAKQAIPPATKKGSSIDALLSKKNSPVVANNSNPNIVTKKIKNPSLLGGVYLMDKTNPNALIKTERSNYGGVPTKKGSERADIVPVSLGGVNSAKENIVHEDYPLTEKIKQGVYKFFGKTYVPQTNTDKYLNNEILPAYKSGKMSLREAQAKTIAFIAQEDFMKKDKQMAEQKQKDAIKGKPGIPIVNVIKKIPEAVKKLQVAGDKKSNELYGAKTPEELAATRARVGAIPGAKGVEAMNKQSAIDALIKKPAIKMANINPKDVKNAVVTGAKAVGNFGNEIVKDVIRSTVAEPLQSLANAGANIKELAVGKRDSRGYITDHSNDTSSSPYLGEIKPAITGNESNLEMAKKVVGRGADIASNFIGGEGAASLVKLGLKDLAKKGLIEGLKVGFATGALSGAGKALEQNKSAKDVAIEGAKGGALGAALGGVLGGTVPFISSALGKIGKTVEQQIVSKGEKVTTDDFIKLVDEAITKHANDGTLTPEEVGASLKELNTLKESIKTSKTVVPSLPTKKVSAKTKDQQILADYKTKNGNVVNPDDLRPYFASEGYAGHNAGDFHEKVSALSKTAYTDALKNEGDDAILLAGGSGAGKSSAVKSLPAIGKQLKKAAVVFDGNLSSYDSAIKKIAEAEKAGKKVKIVYVYRDPVEAVDQGVISRMLTNKSEMGRLVPNHITAGNHVGSWDVVSRLHKEGYSVSFIDNSLGRGKAKTTTFEALNAKIQNTSVEDLTKKMNEVTKKAYVEGKLYGDQKLSQLQHDLMTAKPASIPKPKIPSKRITYQPLDETGAPIKKMGNRKIVYNRTIGTPGMSKRIEAQTVEKGLISHFKDMPDYGKVDVPSQAKFAADIINNDYEKAVRIGLGQELPTNGALPESVLIALKNDALRRGDTDLLVQLATEHGGLAKESSVLGQRIKMLDENNPHDAFKNMRDVVKNRDRFYEKKAKTTVAKAEKSEIARMTEEIRKTAPKLDAWEVFAKEIKCRV